MWEAGAKSSSALSHGQGSNSTSRYLLPQRPCPPPVFPRLPSCSQSAFGPVESDLSLSIRSVFREFCCCFWAAYNSRTSRQREEKSQCTPHPNLRTFLEGLAAFQNGTLLFSAGLGSTDSDTTAPWGTM